MSNLPPIPEEHLRVVHVTRSPSFPDVDYSEIAKRYFERGFLFSGDAIGTTTHTHATNEGLVENIAKFHTETADARFVNGLAIIMDIPTDLIKPLDNIPRNSLRAIMTTEFMEKHDPAFPPEKQNQTIKYLIPKEMIVGAIDPNGNFIPNPEYDQKKAGEVAQEMRENLQANYISVAEVLQSQQQSYPRDSQPSVTFSTSTELF